MGRSSLKTNTKNTKKYKSIHNPKTEYFCKLSCPGGQVPVRGTLLEEQGGPDVQQEALRQHHGHRQVRATPRHFLCLMPPRFDLGLKEDRALDKGDSEFYEYKEVIGHMTHSTLHGSSTCHLFSPSTCHLPPGQVPVLGEQVRIYPHTRRVNKFSSARCQVSGCRSLYHSAALLAGW